MLMLSLSLEFDFASLYDDYRTFFIDETYTVRSLVTKIATFINFHNAL